MCGMNCLTRVTRIVSFSYFFSYHMVRVGNRTVETLNIPPVIMGTTLNRWAVTLGWRTMPASGCKGIPSRASACRPLRRRVLLRHQRNRSMVVSIVCWLHKKMSKIYFFQFLPQENRTRMREKKIIFHIAFDTKMSIYIDL